MVLTFFLQSSSVLTSVLIPLCGTGAAPQNESREGFGGPAVLASSP